MSKITNNSRMVLPNISSANITLSYAQRYQHMTKLANYNQMNQGQIWKQYQKLRTCLKQINEQVLYHMERKAYVNLNKQKNVKAINKDSEGTLILLQDEKRTNQLRYSNFYNQLNRLQQRVNYLSGKNHYLEQMTLQVEDLQGKIKKTITDNKDLKRKATVVGKNIVNCTSALDKLVLQQTRLNRALIRYRRFKQYFDSLSNKQSMYKQKISETQEAIDARIKQFSSQQNFIEQQIHYERYEQLKKQRQNLTKYESVYKRNYLIKLKQLEGIINSINRHDKVIQQNDGNILELRNQIEGVSNLVSFKGTKKRSTSSMMQMSVNTVRVRSKQNKQRSLVDVQKESKQNNEKNVRQKQEKRENLNGRKRVVSSMNDKN